MSKYNIYNLRSPDVQTFLSDAKSAIKGAGINPYEKGLIRVDEDGNDVPGRGVDTIEPNRWYSTEPTYDTEGNQTDSGVKGGYALINLCVKDPEVKAFIESFTSSDAGKQPDEIPAEEKIGGGTHRVNKSTIDNPVRVFATV